MNVSRIVFLLIIALFIGNSSAKADDVPISELLEQCEHYRSTSDYVALEKKSHSLIQLATSSSDMRGMCYGYFYQGLSMLFTGHGKTSLVSLDKAWDMSRELQNDTIGALVMNARGIYQALNENNRFVAQNYFFQSLDLASKAKDERMKIRVYGNLLVLSKKHNDKTTLTYARHIYNYGIRHADKEQASIGAYYLATYYYWSGSYDLSRKYIDITLKYYEKEPYDDVAAVYVLYSKIETKKGNLEKAMKLALIAVDHAEKQHQASLQPDAYMQCASVTRLQKQYATSNTFATKAMEISQKFSLSNNIIECYQLIADNFLSLGNKDDALHYLQLANKEMERLATINMDRLIHERKILDDIQKKEQQEEIHRNQIQSQRKMGILLLAIVIVLIVTLTIIIRNYRSRMKLVKSIVARNVKQIEHMEYLHKRIEALESRSHDGDEKTQGTLLDDAGRVNIMFDQITDLMQNQKMYKEPQLTRERLATTIGTNRTYLSTVIKEKTGMGYQQFINSYRINEAARILSDASMMDYPLKQIWSELGFSSASTFYKLFIQQLGITPSVYRRQFNQIAENRSTDNEDE